MAIKNPNCESKECLDIYKTKWEKIAFSCLEEIPSKKDIAELRKETRSLMKEIFETSGEKFSDRILIFPTTIHCAVAHQVLTRDNFKEMTDLQIEKLVNKKTDDLINNKLDLSFNTLPNFQGRMNAEWFAYLDWFVQENDPDKYLTDVEIGGIAARQKILELFLFWAPFEECVMCVLPPKKINLDAQGRWDSRNDWAFSFLDERIGFVAIENNLFPPHVVFDKNKITIEEIKKETNAEKRRILREQMGDERYLNEIGAKVVHLDTILVDKVKKTGHQILRALMVDSFGDKYLVANDGSTDRVYVMSVNPEVKTCAEAHESMCRHIPGLKDSDISLNA